MTEIEWLHRLSTQVVGLAITVIIGFGTVAFLLHHILDELREKRKPPKEGEKQQ